MKHLPSMPGGPPLDDDRLVPIDDPDEPMTETTLRQLKLDRAADEGMTAPPEPEMDPPRVDVPGPAMKVPGTDVPGPEDAPRRPGVEVPGTEVPGPTDEPTEPVVDRPGRDDRPPIVTAESLAAGLVGPTCRSAFLPTERAAGLAGV